MKAFTRKKKKLPPFSNMWSRTPWGGVFYPSNWTLGDNRTQSGLASCSSYFSLIWGTVVCLRIVISVLYSRMVKVCIPFSDIASLFATEKSQLFFFFFYCHYKLQQELGIYVSDQGLCALCHLYPWQDHFPFPSSFPS